MSASKSSTDCHERVIPARARRSGDHPETSVPSRWMLPEPRRVKPVIRSSRVVLPAPLGPISPTTSPGATSKETSSTATTPPKRTETPRTSSERPRRGNSTGATAASATRGGGCEDPTPSQVQPSKHASSVRRPQRCEPVGGLSEQLDDTDAAEDDQPSIDVAQVGEHVVHERPRPTPPERRWPLPPPRTPTRVRRSRRIAPGGSNRRRRRR